MTIRLNNFITATALTSGDVFYITQGGVEKQVSASAVLTFLTNSIAANGLPVTVATASGDGSTVNFTLPYVPGSVNNVRVILNGLALTPTTDYTNPIGTSTITMSTPPALGDELVFWVGGQSAPGISVDSSMVAYTPTSGGTTNVQSQLRAITAPTGSSLVGFQLSSTGAAAQTLFTKVSQTVSVTDFYANGVSGALVDPTGVIDSTLGIQAAINTGLKVLVPDGVYKTTATLTSYGKDFILVGRSESVIGEKNNQETNFTGTVINYFGPDNTSAIAPLNSSTTNQIVLKNIRVVAPKTITAPIVTLTGTTVSALEYPGSVTFDNVAIQTRGFSVSGSALVGYTMTGLAIDCTAGGSWGWGWVFNNVYIFGVQTGISVKVAGAGFFNSSIFRSVKMYQVYRTLLLQSATGATGSIAANLFDGLTSQPNTQLGVFASGNILMDGATVIQNVFIAPNIYDTTSGSSYLTINNSVRWGKDNIFIGAQSNDIVNGTLAYPGWGLQSNGTQVNCITQTFLTAAQVAGTAIIQTINDQNTTNISAPRNAGTNDYNVSVSSFATPSLHLDGVTGVQYSPHGFGTVLTRVGSATYAVPDATCRIINGCGATATYTLPTATNGRELTITNNVAQAVNSASSNVYQIATGSLSTAILPATAGKWVTLVADGTYWNIVAGN